jgi:hypothetical protein
LSCLFGSFGDEKLPYVVRKGDKDNETDRDKYKDKDKQITEKDKQIREKENTTKGEGQIPNIKAKTKQTPPKWYRQAKTKQQTGIDEDNE